MIKDSILVMQELEQMDLIYRIHLLKELLTHYQHMQDIKDKQAQETPHKPV